VASNFWSFRRSLSMRPARVSLQTLGPSRRPFTTTPHVKRLAGPSSSTRVARQAHDKRLLPFNFNVNLFQAIDRLKVKTSPEIQFLSRLVRLSPAYLADLAKKWASRISGKTLDTAPIIDELSKAG
jgi:hypothetical protein